MKVCDALTCIGPVLDVAIGRNTLATASSPDIDADDYHLDDIDNLYFSISFSVYG